MGTATTASPPTSDTTAALRSNASRQQLPMLPILAWVGVVALALYFLGTHAVRYFSLDEVTYGP